MSLLSWFSRKPVSPPAASPESSGMSRMEATRPVTPAKRQQARTAAPAAPEKSGQAANRKTERMARRELLYSVVRECMVRAGVLSSSYKFKVLSLDQRGRQFLVMMDLAHEFGGDTTKLAEIEALIAQSAKSRFDIVVTAVYWRINEHVAVGAPEVRTAPAQEAAAKAQPASPAPHNPHFEPIAEDEMAAFQRALAAGQSPAAEALEASGRSPNYTLLTGYEDTEMPDPDAKSPALGATQYGGLN